MLRMVLFLAVFLTLYTGMHLLLRWGVGPLLAPWPGSQVWLDLWLAAMILAPVGVRLLEAAGAETVARTMALVGYLWMGFLFLAFCGFVLVGLGQLLLRSAVLVWPGLPVHSTHGVASAVVVLLVAAGAGLYGLVEAAQLRVERVSIETAKLHPGQGPWRIVQISDLHLGLLLRKTTLARVVQAVAALKPDLVVATGDLVDAQINHLDGLSELLNRLQPPLGKYAVTGNHEYYAGLAASLDFIRRSGFQLLRATRAEPAPGLVLLGVDDPTGGSVDEGRLPWPPPEAFVVLLKHRPQLSPAAAGRFDLQLSGHTHRGQMFPFNWLTALGYPLQDGLYPLPGGSHLYTSRGTGTWGPPMRLGSPPEITLIEVVPAEAAPAQKL